METCTTCHDVPENCSCVDKIEPLNPFSGATREQLGQWYCDLNSFHWPEDLPVARPEGFAAMKNKEKHADPFFQSIFRQLKAAIPPRERSRAWHIYKMGRTEEQWEDWWKENSGSVEEICRVTDD